MLTYMRVYPITHHGSIRLGMWLEFLSADKHESTHYRLPSAVQWGTLVSPLCLYSHIPLNFYTLIFWFNGHQSYITNSLLGVGRAGERCFPTSLPFSFVTLVVYSVLFQSKGCGSNFSDLHLETIQ